MPTSDLLLLLLCRMDDNSCVMKLAEIVPVDNKGSCCESADVELSPCHIKVCMQHVFHV